VSIVLGSYNRSRLIQQALDTIRSECAGVAHEIIVIDGGSDDGALEWLVRQKDIVTVVQYNRGEIAGRTLPRRSWGYFMNLGFKAAQGKYVLMLSDDCLLIRGAVNTGVQYAEDLQQAGRRIGGVAFYFRNWPDEVEYYVQATIGGKLMVNHGLFLRRALEEVGWADEDRYRFYKADGDLSLRLWEAGYEIVDCPGAFVEHYVDAGEVVRRSNSAVLDRDRLAYRDRWEPVYPNGSGYGRLTLSFEDPENTARRFVQALAHDE
jgi:GT2 family glycosyltransferase